ncbi:hypothetical protein HME9304_01484 [Flagellimonas maritima]|uniref:Lipoprotein n=1 Tax=Flagellimonas maritima TaxID=1383885 RepID=A0A2Z4LRS9_9FLAO|nr:hypothetical protein [Allomuricauda aurantiaca]AWX44482.1 hypothetical protein HME9304_01484 [Allomuricauda aurantiaca]
MKKIKLTFLSIIIITLFSCNQKVYKALNELKNMPLADYSYVIEPKYTESQESAEFKVKELFSAEESKIGTYHIHGYDKETKEQINERMWLQTVLLNSKNLTDYRNEELATESAKEVAEFVIKQLSNVSDYEKIQITFVRQWNDGNIKQEKRTVYLTIPKLNKTEF